MDRKILQMSLGEHSYDIIIERGALSKASEYMKLSRKVLIVTDSGVPTEYVSAVADAFANSHIFTFPLN